MRLRLLALPIIAAIVAACGAVPVPASPRPIASPTPVGSSLVPSAPATPATSPGTPSPPSTSPPAGSGPIFQPDALAFRDTSLGFLGGGYSRPDGSVAGVVMETRDGGRHWRTILITTAAVAELWVAGGEVWARTTCNGSNPPCTPLLLRRVAAGGTWFAKSADLGAISFVDARHGWAAADSPGPGAVPTYRTADGGVTWTSAPSPCRGSPVGPLRAIAFRSASVGLALCAYTIGAGGEFRSVLRTTNGGATWHVVATVAPPPVPAVGTMPYGGYARGLVVTTDGTAWLWGDRMVPLASPDGGATWRPLAIGEADALPVNAAWPLDAQHGFALLWDPTRQATLVEATADGGRTWVVRAAIPVSAIPSAPGVPTAVEILVPALTVDHPMVIVTPSSGLHDGQTVVVRVTGFGVGGEVHLSECATAAAVTNLGCGVELAAQTLLVSNDDRSGSATFVVHARAAVKPPTTNDLVPCDGRCVIVATQGIGPGLAYAPIGFR